MKIKKLIYLHAAKNGDTLIFHSDYHVVIAANMHRFAFQNLNNALACAQILKLFGFKFDFFLEQITQRDEKGNPIAGCKICDVYKEEAKTRNERN